MNFLCQIYLNFINCIFYMIIIILAILGLILSIYILQVELNLKKNKKYKSICDINKRISCSKVVLSKYNDIFFGIPNSTMGLFYYISILISYVFFSNYLFYLNLAGFLASLPLAYFSIIKLRDLCLVCISIYIVNILLLLFSYLKI